MYNKNLFTLFILSVLAFTPTSIQSEILEVTASWNSYSCDEKCAEMIRKRFEKLKQIESVTVNPSSGVAHIKWNPKSSFSYSTIKTELQLVGVGLSELRVRVRGRGVIQGNGVALSSIGDNTRFNLISPIRAQQGEYVALPDGSALTLSSSLQDKILSASQENKVIVVEGPIYQGHRSPPLHLIVSRLQIEKK